MLDINLLRKDPVGVTAKLKSKDPEVNVPIVLELDEQLRKKKTEVETLKAERNDASKKIGEMKRKGQDTTELMNKVSGFADKIHDLDREIRELEAQYEYNLASLPNLPMDDVKVSLDKKENVIIKEWGEPRYFDFEFRNHVELGEQLNLFDFKRGAKIAGTGFPAYCGLGARLEWALLQYMIDVHVANGFTQWFPPLLVKEEIMFGSGQLPKFEGQQYRINDPEFPFFLIPTAEVPLNGLHYDEILPEEELPLWYCAYTPCFRREAGAAGSQERGLIRVHQFNKVEMFCFCKPEESMDMFQRMLASAESLVEGLDLHYRSSLLVTGDMSFGSARTVDVEVWLPGQNRYYEVSSVSNCTDYQARRSKIRLRRKGGGKPEFVHTLNGSGLATSRLMVAVLENNQNRDGSITIPGALQKYLGGMERIEPKKPKWAVEEE